MAKRIKQITAKCSPNRLERRFRDYAVKTKVEDIRAEQLSEDELVEEVKFIKAELLRRVKKYNLDSTKNNILKIRSFFDLNRLEDQYDQALGIAISQIEFTILANEAKEISEEYKKALINEAKTVLKLLKEFRNK